MLLTWLAVAVAFALGLAIPAFFRAVASNSNSGPTTTDKQADLLDQAISRDLTTGFLAPGVAYGGYFSAGTLVAQTEQYGGAVLSITGTADRFGGTITMTVMLGLDPVTAEDDPIDAGTYPVECYQYNFGLYLPSLGPQTSVACPTRRVDGAPGSPIAEYGGWLSRQPSSTLYAMATNTYPQTPQGALALLQAKKFVSSTDTYRVVSEVSQGTAYLVGLNINGDCAFVRIDSNATDSVVPFWLAPMDQQLSCNAGSAQNEIGLLGTSAAQEG